jgi:hypothetical protein
MENFWKLAALSLTVCCLIFVFDNARLNHEVDELTETRYWDRAVIDSLHSELYIKELELQHQLAAWSILEEVNPILANSIDQQVD